MEPPEYPPNSLASKREFEEKNIVPVTTAAVRKKKSLRRKFSEVFVAGDLKTAVSFALVDIFIPAVRDVVLDVFQSGMEKWIRGDSYKYRGVSAPPSGPYGHVNYTRYSTSSSRPFGSGPQRALSRQARTRHDFDEIILETRNEAEEVIDRLFDLVSRYDTATVADLYELVGLSSTHADQKWGWTDLRGAGVARIRDGYLLDLPNPHPL